MDALGVIEQIKSMLDSYEWDYELCSQIRDLVYGSPVAPLPYVAPPIPARRLGNWDTDPLDDDYEPDADVYGEVSGTPDPFTVVAEGHYDAETDSLVVDRVMPPEVREWLDDEIYYQGRGWSLE